MCMYINDNYFCRKYVIHKCLTHYWMTARDWSLGEDRYAAHDPLPSFPSWDSTIQPLPLLCSFCVGCGAESNHYQLGRSLLAIYLRSRFQIKFHINVGSIMSSFISKFSSFCQLRFWRKYVCVCQTVTCIRRSIKRSWFLWLCRWYI